MMKKILTALLAAAMLLSAAACKNNSTPDNTGEYKGTLTELAAAIYKKVPVDLGLGDAEKIDITNRDNVTFYLGLTSADSIKEAVFSEPMMNALAYSLCLIRAKEGADIHAMVKEIFENVNTHKWVCVEADDLIVGNSGDIIMLIMTDSEFGETLASDLFDAFKEIVGADGEKLSK